MTNTNISKHCFIVSSILSPFEQIERLGYEGCKNCKHQKHKIDPLKMCKLAEQNDDGCVHLICPMWDKEESEEEK